MSGLTAAWKCTGAVAAENRRQAEGIPTPGQLGLESLGKSAKVSGQGWGSGPLAAFIGVGVGLASSGGL